MPKTAKILAALTALVLLGAAAVFLRSRAPEAANAPIVIGYQTVIDPSKVPQASGAYDQALGRPVQWKKFSSGAEVITALASGDLDIADLGSSPLAVAATQQVPLQVVAVIAELGSSEALVARNGSGITAPQALAGKRVAVPFVSTAHYSLLAALRHWGVDAKQVTLLNLAPPQIAAAWKRGDIDAAYVWDPALGELKRGGAVLTTSAEVSQWGAPTFEAWVVRRDFLQKNPEAVRKFVEVTLAAHADYRQRAAQWTADSPEVAAIARLTGAAPADIPALLAGNRYPLAQEQLEPSLLGGGLADALAATAGFLHEQGRVAAVLPDYRAFLAPEVVRSLPVSAETNTR